MRIAIAVGAVAVVLALVLIALFLWRLRSLSHRVGSFECAKFTGNRWLAGIASYTRDHLDWYEVVSLSLRPTTRWERRELDILDRSRREVDGRLSSVSEARCVYRDEEFLLAANDQSLDGLRSWLEAAPPDPNTSRIV
ncbi:DUF2550 domain-containing protein [Occultella aeris]|uniref:DUF2550 family protein n=1 Tax=Occultella aeris TaxID=2761496 RepID=A0A7M4DMP1_9MICO|nr:DUF2550 family protein [Occultella aeris]VZO38685.1 hypothetical protein HALOF300_03417 [Occultella aeris]